MNGIPAANPLPFGQGNGGSPWVYMANRLVGATVPLPFGADPCGPRYQPDGIRLARCEIARTLPRCDPGPTTDDLGPPFRQTKYRIHMNIRGLAIHGGRWADVLLHTPALIPGPPIPPR